MKEDVRSSGIGRRRPCEAFLPMRIANKELLIAACCGGTHKPLHNGRFVEVNKNTFSKLLDRWQPVRVARNRCATNSYGHPRLHLWNLFLIIRNWMMDMPLLKTLAMGTYVNTSTPRREEDGVSLLVSSKYFRKEKGPVLAHRAFSLRQFCRIRTEQPISVFSGGGS